MQGKDGKLYGATDGGRPLNEGNLYKVTPAGVNTGLTKWADDLNLFVGFAWRY